MKSKAKIVAQLVNEREDELDDLLSRIDEQQETYEMLLQQIEMTEKEITDQEISSEQHIKEFSKSAPLSVKFSQEHDIEIREMQNAINYSIQQNGETEERINQLQSELNALKEERFALAKQRRDQHSRIEKSLIQQKHLKESMIVLQEQISEQKQEISGLNRNTDEAEKAIAGLKMREQNIMNTDVKQLEEQLVEAECELSDLENEISQTIEKKNDIISKFDEEIDAQIRSVQWETEKKSLVESIEIAQTQLNEVQQNAKNSQAYYNILQQRYQKLVPIVHKNEKIELIPINMIPTDTNVDKLLFDIEKNGNHSIAVDSQLNEEMNDIVIHNAELEASIAKLKREIEQRTILIAAEIQDMKQKINTQRLISSDKEKGIVDDIINIKIKIAQRELDKNIRSENEYADQFEE